MTLASLTRRFQRIPGQQGPPSLWIGALLIALLGLALYTLATRSVPLPGGDPGTTVKAQFAEAVGVRSGTPVRVRGVSVGEVEGVELSGRGGGANVKLRIDDDAATPRGDARAQIRWRTLFGGSVYVDLDPGTPTAKRTDAIPASRTASQVELQDLFQPLARGGRDGARAFISGLSDGLSSPDAAGAAVRELQPAMKPLGRAATALRGHQRGDLTRLTRGVAGSFRAITKEEGRLASLVTSGANTFQEGARHAEDIDQLLALAPATLTETRLTFRRLDPTLAATAGLASRLRPGARRLAGTASEARHFFAQLDPVLRGAEPLLPELKRGLAELSAAGRPGAPLLRNLQPTLRRLDGDLIPFLQQRSDATRLRNYEAIGPALAGASSATSQFDVNGTYLRFSAPSNDSSFAALPCRAYLTEPTAEELLRCDALQKVLEDIFNPNVGGK